MKNNALIKAIGIMVLAFVAGIVLYALFSPSPTPNEGQMTRIGSPIGRSGAGQGVGQGFGQIVRQLNLTAAQISTFRAMELNYRDSVNYLIAQMDSLDAAIIKELTQEYPNETLLTNMAISSGETQMLIKQKTIKHFMALRQICTPAQLEKYQSLFEEMNHLKQRQGHGIGRDQGKGQQRRRGRP